MCSNVLTFSSSLLLCGFLGSNSFSSFFLQSFKTLGMSFYESGFSSSFFHYSITLYFILCSVSVFFFVFDVSMKVVISDFCLDEGFHRGISGKFLLYSSVRHFKRACTFGVHFTCLSAIRNYFW